MNLAEASALAKELRAKLDPDGWDVAADLYEEFGNAYDLETAQKLRWDARLFRQVSKAHATRDSTGYRANCHFNLLTGGIPRYTVFLSRREKTTIVSFLVSGVGEEIFQHWLHDGEVTEYTLSLVAVIVSAIKRRILSRQESLLEFDLGPIIIHPPR